MKANAHVGLWVIPGLLALLAELWYPSLWAVAFALGIVIEIWAAVDAVAGNTLSEIIWDFKQPGDWSRAFFVAGLAIYISYRFWQISAQDAAATVLAVGLCLWLVIHFVWRGRFG